ncbi:restriction endonuclease subunit S [Chryseobacterium sp. VD8]|uniref:restriction endonuclease subunit S n=1 Tax=Chryseobacterium sp. VD8 TaxID=3081254 RepID=UPI003017D022
MGTNKIIQNWQIKKLGEVCEIRSGKNQKNVVNPNGKYPIYGSSGIFGYADDYISEANTTIIGRKGTINNPIYVTEKFWNVDTAFGLHSKEELNSKYLFYFCKSFNFHKLDKSTTIPSLSKTDLHSIEVPIPPLETQHAIVSKIEELFSELDKGIAELKTAQQQVKTYRQSVLKSAFLGEWEILNIKDITVDIFAGGDKPKEYSELKNDIFPYPIYANAVAKKGLYGFTNFARVKEECVTIAGRGSGTGHIELRSEPFLPIVRLIVVIPKKDIITSKFLFYYLKSLTIEIEGSAIPQLTIPTVKEYLIPVPSLSEQHSIVQEIESRLSVVDKMEQSIQKNLQKAEALRQSILKKAFCGELV